MNFFEATDYCQSTHGATLPIFQSRMGPNHVTIDQEVTLNGKSNKYEVSKAPHQLLNNNTFSLVPIAEIR